MSPGGTETANATVPPANSVNSSGSSIGVLDFFGAGIQTGLNLAVGVVNGLIDAGRFLVVNGIKLAAQPILDQVARVASALEVVALVTGLLRPWTIRMDASPPQTRVRAQAAATSPVASATAHSPSCSDQAQS